MAVPPIPDPYLALGLSKDATAAQIKSVYRKLALKCHPDKVVDESLKDQAADQFHRIQQAYEILGDEDRKERYDAQIRLNELRKEVIERQAAAAKVEVKTAGYEFDTSSPGRGTFTARGPERVTEVRKPSFDDDRDADPQDYFSSPRPSPRRTDSSREYRHTPKSDADRIKVMSKESKKAERSDKRRVSDKNRHSNRDQKQRGARVEDYSDDSDDQTTLSSARRRESEREKEQYHARRHKEQTPELLDETYRKTSSQADFARDYILRSTRGSETDRRPSLQPSSSYRDYNEPRERPQVMVRRSSARPSSSTREPSSRRSKDKDRKYSDVDDVRPSSSRKYSVPDTDALPTSRQPPPLKTFQSAPAGRFPTTESRRSQTAQPSYEHPDPVIPTLRRSETTPVFSDSKSSSRRKEVPVKSSPLRPSDTYRPTEIHDGYATPGATPEYVSPIDQLQNMSTKYRSEENYGVSNGRRTVVLEPETRDRSRVTRSPSPIRRSSRSNATSRHAASPGLSRTHSGFVSSPVESPTSYSRKSPERFFAEFADKPVSASTTKRYEYPDPPRDKVYRYSPDPETVSYSKKPMPEDMKMASGYTTKRGRPVPGRTMSYAY